VATEMARQRNTQNAFKREWAVSTILDGFSGC
jgi:hypothetical protein